MAVSYMASISAALGAVPVQTVILFRCERIVSPDCVTSKAVAGKWDMHDLDIMPRTWPAEVTRDDLPPLEEDEPFRSGGELPGE